ncbi:helix-turn-helix transcriptional regulator [Roseateles sp. UC29_93]|uniref:helix-turn-helix transcriptional regulator n=1 Tax=Roseateles sp. UC29_93 TaxID=3350177 RepID=UPI0036722840
MSADHSVLNRHLLLQLGERLRALRIARGMTALEMAAKVGVSRMTLRAVESGDPRTSIGIYLSVMTVLGVNQEIAMLAGDTFAPCHTRVRCGPLTAAADAGEAGDIHRPRQASAPGSLEPLSA